MSLKILRQALMLAWVRGWCSHSPYEIEKDVKEIMTMLETQKQNLPAKGEQEDA